MNKSSNIHIKMGTGKSNSRTIGETVSQGSIGGALLSSLNLDNGVQQYFSNSSSEIYYGNVRLQPLIFQDDLARMSTSVDAAQTGNNKID